MGFWGQILNWYAEVVQDCGVPQRQEVVRKDRMNDTGTQRNR